MIFQQPKLSHTWDGLFENPPYRSVEAMIDLRREILLLRGIEATGHHHPYIALSNGPLRGWSKCNNACRSTSILPWESTFASLEHRAELEKETVQDIGLSVRCSVPCTALFSMFTPLESQQIVGVGSRHPVMHAKSARRKSAWEARQELQVV